MTGKRPRPETHGDNEYKGNGTLKCNACHQPFADHPMLFPCSFLGEGRIYVQPPNTKGRRANGDVKRTEQKAASRQRTGRN